MRRFIVFRDVKISTQKRKDISREKFWLVDCQSSYQTSWSKLVKLRDQSNFKLKYYRVGQKKIAPLD